MKQKWRKQVIAGFVCLALVMASFSGIGGNVRVAKAEAEPISGGASREQATEIFPGREYIDTLTEEQTEDWFSFQTPAYDSYVVIEGTNFDIAADWGNNFTTKMYSEYDETMGSFSVGSNSYNNKYIRVAANRTYYVRCYHENNKTGRYKLKISFKKDIDGNGRDVATEMNLNRTYERDLAADGDEDWFTFTAPADGDYAVAMKNNNMGPSYGNNFTLNITTANSENILSKSAGSGQSVAGSVTLEQGHEYFVQCYHPSGDRMGHYSFTITAPEGVEVSGEETETKPTQTIALPISGGASKQEAAKIPQPGSWYIDTLTEESAEDWFSFQTPAYDSYVVIEGTNYDIAADWGNNFTTKMYSEYDETMGSFSVGSNSYNNKYIRVAANRTYYVRCYHENNKTGRYKLKISFKKDIDGNGRDVATEMNLNRTYERDLAADGDEDWFTFTAPADGDYAVAMKNNDMDPSYGNNFTLNITTANSETILSKSAGSGQSVTGSVTLEQGHEYFVQCYHPSGDRMGHYSFKITAPEGVEVPAPTDSP